MVDLLKDNLSCELRAPLINHTPVTCYRNHCNLVFIDSTDLCEPELQCQLSFITKLMLLISLKQGLIEDIPFISDSLLYSNLVFSAIKCDIINKK